MQERNEISQTDNGVCNTVVLRTSEERKTADQETLACDTAVSRTPRLNYCGKENDDKKMFKEDYGKKREIA